MTDPKIGQTTTPEAGTELVPGTPLPQSPIRTLRVLPGIVAVSLYMMLLAIINVVAVGSGQIRPAFLIFSALFIAAGLGLLMLLRWAWAMTLAAMVLLVALFIWRFSVSHNLPFAIQGLLNFVFFLYLVRAQVRERLR